MQRLLVGGRSPRVSEACLAPHALALLAGREIASFPCPARLLPAGGSPRWGGHVCRLRLAPGEPRGKLLRRARVAGPVRLCAPLRTRHPKYHSRESSFSRLGPCSNAEAAPTCRGARSDVASRSQTENKVATEKNLELLWKDHTCLLSDIVPGPNDRMMNMSEESGSLSAHITEPGFYSLIYTR